MITKDGTRCATCGSEAPRWIDPADFDGFEDANRAYSNWEAIHQDCADRKERPR